MATSFSFKQGEDKIVNAVIEETPAIDFSTAVDIIALIKVGGVLAYKYSKNTKTGYGTLEVDSVNHNQLNIILERSQTKNFTVGALSVYILADWTNVDFPGGKETKCYDMGLGRVSAGEGLDETLS